MASREAHAVGYCLHDELGEAVAVGEAARVGWRVGLTLHWHPPVEEEGSESRKWSLARKQSVRRKRLRSRLERKSPMFAEDEYRLEVSGRPEYYGVEDGVS